MRKLGRPTDQRMAMLRNLATNLLWYGQIETTLHKAKEVQSYAEKLITKAINAHEDTVKATKTVVNDKGVKTKVAVVNDGPKKLAVRRYLLKKTYPIKEVRLPKETKAAYEARTQDIKFPLIEKVFNEIAPRYAKRAQELGTGGGYTRILKLDNRAGDNAQMVVIQLI